MCVLPAPPPPPPWRLGLYAAVLQEGLLALRPAALGAVGVALGPVVVLLVGPRPGPGPRVLRDEERHQQGEQHGTGAEQEWRARNDGTLEGGREGGREKERIGRH